MAKLEDYAFRHEGVVYCFTIEAQEATFESKLAKRKIFKDVEVLNALIPGSKNQSNSALVDDDLIERKGIREFYDKWKSGAGAQLDGTPISHFEDLTVGQVKSLEANNFKTIEAFAEMDDSLLTLVGPNGRTLRDKARAMTGFSADEGVKALKAENESMKSQLEEMRAQIAALASKPAEPPAPPSDLASDPFQVEAEPGPKRKGKAA